MRLLVVFFGALLTSAALTRWVRDSSNARGWTAGPSSDRHIHTRRIPRLGGVAIFLTLWGAVLLALVAELFGAPEFIFLNLAFKILGPATIIFGVGLVDDFHGLSAYVKFAAQGVAATLLFWSGFGISHLSLLAGHPHLGWLVGLPLTILWVVLITNAFNLIDGLDGLAAGAALFSALVNCVVAVLFHNEGILVLTLALAGAIAGFLRYNFNPASIFLGDCGSLLVGFLLSAIALAGSQKAPTAVAVAIPVVSLGLPILDVAVAVFRRFLSCKRLFAADREHIHHKLLGLGISHRQAVLVLYGVSACFGVLSLFLLHPASILVTAVLIVAGIGVIAGVQQLRYHEFVELGRVANRTLKQRHVIANDINIRRAPEALKSCASLPQFCQILQQCLEPAGFDGFGLYLSSETGTTAEAYPFGHISGSEFRLFWNQALRLSETNWYLSFNLLKRTGEPLGGFTLFRKSGSSPLLMDLEVFSGTGFSNAVAAVVEKEKDSWFVRVPKERIPVPGLEATGSAIGLLVPRVAEAPSSG
jgi:UDP-GlcNAc:undecaprenyl-phosphate/decaprenyl-phosphate GlcNAc-1-phosphate transferase